MNVIARRHDFSILRLFCLIVFLFILGASLFIQIVYKELPCPLCLIQRLGILGICFSIILDLKYGLHIRNDAIGNLFAYFTALVAMRQILLHIVPNTGAYGMMVMGLHLYTWSFIVVMIYLFTSLLFSLDERQYGHTNQMITKIRKKKIVGFLIPICCLATILIALLNVILVFLECGITQCPDNPVKYKYFASIY